MRNYHELLEGSFKQQKFLCVGLDCDYEKIPEHARQTGMRETLLAFNRAIVDATCDIVGAYKPNTAFYESHGDDGWAALRETIMYIHEVAPLVPVILDAKRGDNANSNIGYTTAAFDHLHADAVTVHPYLGSESLRPFLERKEKGIIVLCRTSNPGAGEVQDLVVDGEPLYVRVARLVAEKWNSNGNCGLVVGATYPTELAAVRSAVKEMPILIPGIGEQGGDLKKTVLAGKSAKGGMIINASRSIIFAGKGKDFAEAARAKAEELDREIKAALE